MIALQENLGYGPANNVGLEHARGEYLCFLNSDVMPDTPHWLDLMVQDLRSDPGIGIVGGLLLFEDGTVQHEGMCYERLPEMANWPFPMHPNKGRLPAAGPDLAPTEAVTGACMVMRTDLTRELGGFDEIYAIGDFEELRTLCMRVRERGLAPHYRPAGAPVASGAAVASNARQDVAYVRHAAERLDAHQAVVPGAGSGRRNGGVREPGTRRPRGGRRYGTGTRRPWQAAGETAVSGSPTSDGREMAADMADVGMETRG